jgi:thiol-disulfide isomerase/thioredoxin
MLYILTSENKKTISDIIKKSKNITILFHWDMCGHCAALKPTWNKVCKKYNNDAICDILNVELSQINNLCSKYRKGINGFPTIIKYKNGKKIAEYNDDRSFNNIIKFVKS